MVPNGLGTKISTDLLMILVCSLISMEELGHREMAEFKGISSLIQNHQVMASHSNVVDTDVLHSFPAADIGEDNLEKLLGFEPHFESGRGKEQGDRSNPQRTVEIAVVFLDFGKQLEVEVAQLRRNSLQDRKKINRRSARLADVFQRYLGPSETNVIE